MTLLKRGRAALCVAALLAVLVFIAEFPLAGLVHARSSAETAAADLAAVRAENSALSRQVLALRSGSAVVQLAHEEYGLVRGGQLSLVVMPDRSTSLEPIANDAGTAPLNATTIPRSDLVPSDAALSPEAAGGTGGSFWHRLLERLEFWKASD